MAKILIMQELDNNETFQEVVQEGIWQNLVDFWNLVLFDYEIGGNLVEITLSFVLMVILTFVITSIVLRLIRSFITSKLGEGDKHKFISVFKFIKYTVYLGLVLITLDSTGIDVTILLTASAALLVGIGLALRELFQDIIGGIFIVLDKSLLVGDVIEMDGRVGRVFDIKLRTTRAITRDDKVMIIPNHKLISNVVYNYTQNHKSTREAVEVRAAFGSDVRKIEKILIKCAKENGGILKSPEPFILFEDFGESALMFSLNFFVSDSFVDPKIKSELRFKIDEEFRTNNITIPLPQQDLRFYPAQNSPKNE